MCGTWRDDQGFVDMCVGYQQCANVQLSEHPGFHKGCQQEIDCQAQQMSCDLTINDSPVHCLLIAAYYS